MNKVFLLLLPTLCACATQWEVREKILDAAVASFPCDRQYLNLKQVGTTHRYEVQGCRRKAIFQGTGSCYTNLTLKDCQVFQVNPERP
jgi:hypothetical protein